MRFVRNLFIYQEQDLSLQTLQKLAAHIKVSRSVQLRVCLVPVDESLPNAEPYVVVAGA